MDIKKVTNAILEGASIRGKLLEASAESRAEEKLDLLIKKAKKVAVELKASPFKKSIQKIEVTTGLDDAISLDSTAAEIKAKLSENSWYVDETKYLLILVHMSTQPDGIKIVARRLKKMFNSDVDTHDYEDYGCVSFSVKL